MAEVARLFPAHAGDDHIPAVEMMSDSIRIAEALLFAATEPLEERQIADRLPDGVAVTDVLEALRRHYSGRGINLVRVARKWMFRTAADLGWLLSRESTEQKKLSRPALETLAIIAYHQPATRAEVEDIRGVALSRGTLDLLLETGWVRLRGRRKAPGRPVTYGTTEAFLLHFGLETISDLPGLDELKAAGLFDGRLPQGFGIPSPRDDADLTDDEDPLEEGDLFGEAHILEAADEMVEEGEDVASDASLSFQQDGVEAIDLTHNPAVRPGACPPTSSAHDDDADDADE